MACLQTSAINSQGCNYSEDQNGDYSPCTKLFFTCFTYLRLYGIGVSSSVASPTKSVRQQPRFCPVDTMSSIPLWCLILHVMGLHGYMYRHGRSWNGYGFHTYPHPAKKGRGSPGYNGGGHCTNNTIILLYTINVTLVQI
ncbi:hypothetical protein NQ315_003446 [Exocentrus adspersus]|uniref:Uncharacterized protein n=1 Tax=Exocentrus adspersus TaxID=1586481 RepID=A0AAV8VMS3_9CUCU|nr:hypothetical protein NQ315_003446 [Exocentrus adspersus]